LQTDGPVVISIQDDSGLRALTGTLDSLGSEPRLVVMLGSSQGRFVRALSERPGAPPLVLVLEPNLESARRVHEQRARDARLADRLVLYGPDQLAPTHDFVAAYLTVCQFLMRSKLPGRAIRLVIDPLAEATPMGRSLKRAALDLQHGFSREFLHVVASRPELTTLLRGVGDYFAAQGEPYTALKFYSQLPAPLLSSAAEAAARCLLALGNRELAEHWLGAAPIDEHARAELLALVVASAPPAFDAAACLESNLRFLERTFPDAANALRASEPAADLHRLDLGDGPPLLVRATGLQLVEENARIDPSELQTALAGSAAQGQDHVCIGRWVKYADAARLAISTPTLVRQHGWRRITFLLESDVPALLSLLAADPLEPWFDADQVRLHVGPDAVEHYAASLEANLHQPVPELSIALPAAANANLLERREAKLQGTQELYRALERRYDGHPQRLLQTLEGASRPLRIALMTSRYTTVLQFVTRDLAEAFESLGHRCRVLCEARPGEELVSHGVAEDLLDFEPDFLFVIDHIRPEYQGLLPSGLPVITWVLDELPALKDPKLIAQLGPLDLTYGFNGAIERGFRELGYPRVGRLPFAVNSARYFPEPPALDAHGIAFTTHIGQFDRDPAEAPGLNQRLLARLAALPEILLEMGKIRPILQELLTELGRRVSPGEEQTLLYYALQVARQYDRQHVAERVLDSGLPLEVYGLGWDTLPRFVGRAHPSVAPGAALRQVYRQHRAVLHINRGCNIHPRVLETLASGGLVIARWDPVDDEPGETLASFGEDLCLFRSPEELTALLKRALTDDAFRSDMIARGQARVLAQHTYQSRSSQILGDLRQLLEARSSQSAAVVPHPLSA
jgi:hypothetical protein